jgi:protease I
MAKRILIVATNGFEQSELLEPKKALEEAGYECVVAGPETGQIRGWNHGEWGEKVDVDCGLDEVAESDFAALVLPGGQMNPDILRMEDKAVSLVRDFDRAGKPIAAICHGPWLLIEAGVVKDRTVTGWPSIRTDLRNAGANVVDKEVASDGNLITSRNPDDLPAFNDALIAALEDRTVNA